MHIFALTDTPPNVATANIEASIETDQLQIIPTVAALADDKSSDCNDVKFGNNVTSRTSYNVGGVSIKMMNDASDDLYMQHDPTNWKSNKSKEVKSSSLKGLYIYILNVLQIMIINVNKLLYINIKQYDVIC